MQRKINFVNTDLNYKPNQFVQSLYQVCHYKDENENLYAVRKVKFNQNYEIVDVKVKYYPRKAIKIFIEKNKKIKENRIKLYPCNNINDVGLPTVAELSAAGSSLLNNSVQEYGFAEI
jgi:hypothetical protein